MGDLAVGTLVVDARRDHRLMVVLGTFTAYDGPRYVLAEHFNPHRIDTVPIVHVETVDRWATDAPR